MGLITDLLRDPKAFILMAIPLLYSIIFHELAHGWVAYRMGDPTAKLMGRLSLNPLKHLDPIGTLMLFFVGFGWAKPVPVNFQNLRPRRAGLILVSSAGILTNILLAVAAIFISHLEPVYSNKVLATVFFWLIRINIVLAVFNLIPIPPLDGSKILMGFLPARYQYYFARLEPYGFFIILALLLLLRIL
ncbi:MAG: site-2 protease family protein [Desulfobacteraceae bacterium]|nr:MAG: site-2 protease family protein [Desulfobacteraceae bacterium]